MRQDKKDKRFSYDFGMGGAGVGSRAGLGRASLSGYERNHFFLNHQGKQFSNVSGLSGLDHLADSRSFAVLDFDRDGWQDIAVVNANAPLLLLYRNQIGSQGGAGQMVAIRFVGGNDSAKPTATWSNRDGYGAVVTVKLGAFTLVREHRAGEGLGAQNSSTMLIGIGERKITESIVVRWPSGKVQEASNVPAGTLVTVYENPAHSPNGSALMFQNYKRQTARYAQQGQRIARKR